MISQAGFIFIVALTLVSAFYVVFSKNLVHSAVALLFSLFGVAGLYVFLWADFMAGAQILVYVGGILVLILFGIMLTRKIASVQITHSAVQKGAGGIAVGGILVGLVVMILRTPWFQQEAVEPEGTTRTIGTLILTDYLLAFEVASILLLAALIGAAMLSRKEDR